MTGTVERVEAVQGFSAERARINVKGKRRCFCEIYAEGIFKIKLIYASSETPRVVVWVRFNDSKYKSILLIAGAPYIRFY